MNKNHLTGKLRGFNNRIKVAKWVAYEDMAKSYFPLIQIISILLSARNPIRKREKPKNYSEAS